MDLLPPPRSIEIGNDTAEIRPPSVRVDATLPAQGYRLRVTADGIEIAGGDEAGIFYGQATLDQVHTLHPDRIPCLTITDWPDLAVRGVMLDVSRDKVPTLQTLKDLVNRLASWKINHLQLYMEHTFAYSGHSQVWAAADPFTPADIAELDAHCRARHVELAPNQNCLGHMERWLRHERYRPLAILPEGWTDRAGRPRTPTTIDPAKPESLALVREMLGELLRSFTSRRVHVGLDEPWELPDERFDDYLDYIARMRSLPELDGREMLMWGDIVARHPERARSLPDGVTICEWGYEASHPFEARTQVLDESGRRFWVCPGTSSWNSLVGRWTNARDNLAAAARAGIARGAGGYLVTDWGDNGHLQYLPVSEAPFAFAAAASWYLEAAESMDVAATLDAHVWRDPTGSLSAATLALGDAHRHVAPQVGNMSVLCVPLYSPARFPRIAESLQLEDLTAAQTAVEDALQRVAGTRSARPDAGLVAEELTASGRLVSLLCRDAKLRLDHGGSLADAPASARGELASELSELIDRHRELWLARNRPGGLVDSTRRLERLLQSYLD